MDTWTDSDHAVIKRGDSGQRAGWRVLTDSRRRFGGLRRLQRWPGAKPPHRVWPASTVYAKESFLTAKTRHWRAHGRRGLTLYGQLRSADNILGGFFLY